MQPIVTVFWAGWSDLDSGIDGYEFNLYFLEKANGTLLKHKYMLPASVFSASTVSMKQINYLS
jgi:hypothetical protein